VLGQELLVDFRGTVLDFEQKRCQFEGETPKEAPDPEAALAAQEPPAQRPKSRRSAASPRFDRAGGEGDLRKHPLLHELVTILLERQTTSGAWFFCNTFSGRGRFSGPRFRTSLSRRRPTDQPNQVIRAIDSPARLHPFFRHTLRDLERGAPAYMGTSMLFVRLGIELAARGEVVRIRLYESDLDECAALQNTLETELGGCSFRSTADSRLFICEPMAGMRLEVVHREWTEEGETIEELSTSADQSLLVLDPPTAYMDNWNTLKESSLLQVSGLWSLVFAYSRREDESPIDQEASLRWGGGPYHYYLFGPADEALQDAERDRLATLHQAVDEAIERLQR
jgi:hypothetical protein